MNRREQRLPPINREAAASGVHDLIEGDTPPVILLPEWRRRAGDAAGVRGPGTVAQAAVVFAARPVWVNATTFCNASPSTGKLVGFCIR